MSGADWGAPPCLVDGWLEASSGGPPGRVKAAPADFVVEEIPAYEPAGEGPHVYLWVEKVDVSGPALVREIARRIRVDARDVGMAGMKDRRAVTRQWVSVPEAAADRVERLTGALGESGEIRVLTVSRHQNKLKTGHLRGNRFAVRLRERAPEADAEVGARLAAIAERGFPNAFGPQRFGGGDGVAMGLALLRGERVRGGGRARRMAASAVQSVVFNRWLVARAAGAGLTRPVAGDVLQRRDSGGIFVCESPDEDAPRVARGEVVVTGPLPGSRPSRAKGDALAIEEAVLAELGLEASAFEALGRLGRGARRPALAWPEVVGAERDADGLVTRFVLSSGVYASVLLAYACGGFPVAGPGVASGGDWGMDEAEATP